MQENIQFAKFYKWALVLWKKYSDYFNKNCWGIWGLASIFKYTFLAYFLLFFLPLIGIFKFDDNYTIITLIVFLVSVTIWVLYLPILLTIVTYRFFVTLKRKIIILKREVVILKKEVVRIFKLVVTRQVTPKELYITPHSFIILNLIKLRDYIIDFLDWLTQFIPLNYIFPNRICYPLTMIIRYKAQYMEGLFASLNIPLKYVGYEINMYFTIYKFEFYKKVKDVDKVIRKIRKKTDREKFYVGYDGDLINVIDPHL